MRDVLDLKNSTDDLKECFVNGTTNSAGFAVNGTGGYTGTWTVSAGDTVTISGGIITAINP